MARIRVSGWMARRTSVVMPLNVVAAWFELFAGAGPWADSERRDREGSVGGDDQVAPADPAEVGPV